MRTPIKKAIRTIALLTQRLSNLNFKSKAEFIEAYELEQELNRIERIHRNKRFLELMHLFNIEEPCPFEDQTVSQEKRQKLLWQLADLESNCNE